ncbi:MAG: hypothetical protein SFW62_10245 [Alphaproteobacteria bacterium]|nr:hypothetical protein [Alphaproteobacteria bacterium]
MEQKIFCIDFEASALGPRGYPIEVGVADVQTGETQAWLIKPTTEWLHERIWSEASETIHGISQNQLLNDGQDPKIIIPEVVNICSDGIVLSDNVKSDSSWFQTLCDAIELPRMPFQIQSFQDAACEIAGRHHSDPTHKIEKAIEQAVEKFPNPHRAGPDARRNAEVIRLLLGA